MSCFSRWGRNLEGNETWRWHCSETKGPHRHRFNKELLKNIGKMIITDCKFEIPKLQSALGRLSDGKFWMRTCAKQLEVVGVCWMDSTECGAIRKHENQISSLVSSEIRKGLLASLVKNIPLEHSAKRREKQHWRNTGTQSGGSGVFTSSNWKVGIQKNFDLNWWNQSMIGNSMARRDGDWFWIVWIRWERSVIVIGNG